MSLPRNIVNFEDLARLLEANKGDGEKVVGKGKQKSKGMRLATYEDKLQITDRWKAPSECLITGIKIGVSDRSVIGRDTIDLFIGEVQHFESVYLKTTSEYKNFRIFQKVEEDEVVEVTLNGQTEGVEVWVDIDYVADVVGR